MITCKIHYTFYDKISGTSLHQWKQKQIHIYWHLDYDSLSNGALEESILENNEVFNRDWVWHHFDFDTFRPFGFLDDLF